MKFTEEQAVEALRAELTNKGRKTLAMSERTLAKQTEILVKKFANDEMGLPDFVSDVIEILNTMEGDIRKKNSDFVNKWKEEHPETEPPKNSEPQKQNENPEMKALMERIAALEKDKAESEKKASIAQKRKDLAVKLKEKGVSDSEWIDLQLSKVNFDRKFDMDAEAADYVKLYNKSQSTGGGAPAPFNPKGQPVNQGFLDSINKAKTLAKNERAVIETK